MPHGAVTARQQRRGVPRRTSQAIASGAGSIADVLAV
jgi:hypothetical protein